MSVRCGVRILSALVIAATIVCSGCTHAPNESYYDSHPDDRAAKIAVCSKMYAPANDPECSAAYAADLRAVAAEHGPPFHGHNVAWYRAHIQPAYLEGGYCDKLPQPVSDPDCIAAAKGEVRF
jgi:hypothetical protein